MRAWFWLRRARWSLWLGARRAIEGCCGRTRWWRGGRRGRMQRRGRVCCGSMAVWHRLHGVDSSGST
jgi:hypothetical protein